MKRLSLETRIVLAATAFVVAVLLLAYVGEDFFAALAEVLP